MSLIQCAECKNVISNQAPACPYCGVIFKKKGGFLGGCLSIIFIFLSLIIGLIFFIGSVSSSKKYSQGEDPIMASVMCESFVKDNLKSPSTAIFPSYTKQKIIHEGNDVYKVTAYVDSQNSFGATLRTAYSCTIIRDKDETWKLQNISM